MPRVSGKTVGVNLVIGYNINNCMEEDFEKAVRIKDRTVADEARQRENTSYDNCDAKQEINQSIIHTRQDVIILVSLCADIVKYLRAIKFLTFTILAVLLAILLS